MRTLVPSLRRPAVLGVMVVALAGLPALAQCPYGSIQARVQRNEQDPWKPSMSVPLNSSFRVGAFRDGSGFFVDCCTSVQVFFPNGTSAFVPNGSYVGAASVGTYAVRATCGALSETAYVTASTTTSCPYSSIQTRVQLNDQDPWKPSMSVALNTPFRAGAFRDGTGFFVDCCTALQVTRPDNSLLSVTNGSNVATPLAGVYTLRAACGTLSESATVSVAAPPACPYGSVQAAVQLNQGTPWTGNLGLLQGQSFRVGAFRDGSGNFVDCCTSLRVVRPDGSEAGISNGAYFSTTLAGTYTLFVNCQGKLATATVNAVPAGSCPHASIQAALQASTFDNWTGNLNVIRNQRFRIGAFKNGSGSLAEAGVRLRVTGPQGYVVNPPVNGVFVDAPYAGSYQLTATCGSLTATANATAAETSTTSPMPQRPNIYGLGFRVGREFTTSNAAAKPWDRLNLNKIAETGTLSTHIGFGWADAEPVQGQTYNWDYADHQVAEAEARGLLPFAYSGFTPDWALPAGAPPGSGGLFPPRYGVEASFQSFFRALSQRYCGRVRYYEFWNEPNGCGWKGQCTTTASDAADYAYWLKLWYAAMKQGCADTLLATGGLDCAGFDYPDSCPNYLGWLYDNGAGEYFDAVSFHPYGYKSPVDDSSPYLHLAAIDRVRSLLVTRGQAWKKLWADEWGFHETSDPALKQRQIERVLTELARPERDYIFQARYLTLTDPGDGSYGLCSGDFATLTLACRSSFTTFRNRVKGTGNWAPVTNADMENNTSGVYGRIAGFGPNGGWALHAQYPRPNNQNLGTRFGFYSAGLSERVAQLLPGTRFEALRVYTFKSWAHGGGDNTGMLPYQIGYAAVDGDVNSFQLLANRAVFVGNTWFETNGVTHFVSPGAAEIGKQVIVRFGTGLDGGASDVWFDKLKLVVQ